MRIPTSLSSLKSILADTGVQADDFTGYDLKYNGIVIHFISVDDQWIVDRPGGRTIYDTKELMNNLNGMVNEFKSPP